MNDHLSDHLAAIWVNLNNLDFFSHTNNEEIVWIQWVLLWKAEFSASAKTSEGFCQHSLFILDN